MRTSLKSMHRRFLRDCHYMLALALAASMLVLMPALAPLAQAQDTVRDRATIQKQAQQRTQEHVREQRGKEQPGNQLSPTQQRIGSAGSTDLDGMTPRPGKGTGTGQRGR